MYITIYMPISYRDMNMVKQSNTVSCCFLCILTFRVFLGMGKLPHSINTGNQYTHAEKSNSNLVHLHNTDQSRHEAQSQGRGQSPGHRAGCQDCPGLDGCQHQAMGHPGVQGGAQYRAAEERGDKSSRGDAATSGLCLFSSGLHLYYEQHSRQDVKLQPNVTKSQEHRLHLKFDHLHHLEID